MSDIRFNNWYHQSGTGGVTQTGIGSVGIGITTPSAPLEIADDSITVTKITSLGDDPDIRTTRLDFNFSDGGGAAISAKRAAGVANTETYLSIRTGGSTNDDEKVRITADGYVGINTNTPGSELDVNFNSVSGLSTTLDTEYQVADFRVPVQNNDTIDTRIRLGSRRTVEGGTTSSQAESYIRGNRGGIAIDRGSGGGSSNNAVELTYSTDQYVSSRETAFRVSDDGTMDAFGTVRFGPNGIVNPGNGNTDPGCQITSNQISASRGGGVSGAFNRNNSNGNTVIFRRDGTTVGTISVTASATAYNTESDYRLKENVVPMTGAADRVKALKPSRFNFIVEPDETVDGFLAHEAQAIVPESVIGEKDAVDEDGNPEYQAIDQSKFVPLLTGALQEALAEIDALKARLDAAGL